MAIITSRMVGVDTTANQPAAATAGRLYLTTTTGGAYLTAQYDTGAAWVPWRANISVPLISPTGTALTYVTTNAYADAVANSSMLLDITRFREARLVAWASVGTNTATIKLRDTTTGQDLGGIVTLNSATPGRVSSSWTTIATPAGDIEVSVQAKEGTSGETISLYSVQLELR